MSNSSLIDDLGDCNLPSHDLRILRDISNVPVINMGASNQVCHTVLMDACDSVLERGFIPVSL